MGVCLEADLALNQERELNMMVFHMLMTQGYQLYLAQLIKHLIKLHHRDRIYPVFSCFLIILINQIKMMPECNHYKRRLSGV